MDQVEVDIVGSKTLQGAVDAVLHAMVPGVVQLGSEPDLVSWYTRVLDSAADFGFIAIRKSGVDVAVSGSERILDCLLDFVWA